MDFPVSEDAYIKELRYGAEIKARINSIATQEQIPFIDMNTSAIKKDILTQEDFYDSEHLTRNGSKKVTAYLSSTFVELNK